MAKKPIHYLQTDAKWKGYDYSAPGEKTNIGEQGCGVTSAAMVIASLKDSKVTPVTTADWSKKHGYKAKNCGTYYSYFVPQMQAYDLKCSQINNSNLLNLSDASAKVYHDKALAELQKENWLIACVGPGLWTSSGHYMLVYAYDNGNVLIMDPASTRANKLKNTWALLSSQVKYYWAVEVPKETKAPVTTKAKKTAAKAGDKVTYSGTLYSNSNGGNTVSVKNRTMYVKQVLVKGKYQIQLSATNGGVGIGWVSAAMIKK